MGLVRQGPFEELSAKERKEQRCGTTRRQFHGPAGLWAIPSTTIAAGLSKRPQRSDPKSSRLLFPAWLPRLMSLTLIPILPPVRPVQFDQSAQLAQLPLQKNDRPGRLTAFGEADVLCPARAI